MLKIEIGKVKPGNEYILLQVEGEEPMLFGPYESAVTEALIGDSHAWGIVKKDEFQLQHPTYQEHVLPGKVAKASVLTIKDGKFFPNMTEKVLGHQRLNLSLESLKAL